MTDTTEATILGAAIGGIATYFLVRTPPKTYDRSRGEYDAIGFGLTAAGTIVGALVGRSLAAPSPTLVQSAVIPPSLAQGISSTSGAVLVHLQPNVQTISQALEVNTAVIIYIPTGATWQSMDGAGITDRTSPQAFVFQGPISHTFVWNDANGQTQSSTLLLSVAPTVQTTSV